MIVGLDPGGTSAIAVFDLDGNLLMTESRRGFGKPEIRKAILGKGLPLVIAGDTNPVPKGIRKVASSFSSHILSPERSLGWRDKRRLSEAFLEKAGRRPWKNAHEKDALIAGFYAWKKLRPRLEKLRRKGLSLDRLNLGRRKTIC